MDSRTQSTLLALGSAAIAAVAQHFAQVVPLEQSREANAAVNFECRDQLKIALQALHREMEE